MGAQKSQYPNVPARDRWRAKKAKGGDLQMAMLEFMEQKADMRTTNEYLRQNFDELRKSRAALGYHMKQLRIFGRLNEGWTIPRPRKDALDPFVYWYKISFEVFEIVENMASRQQDAMSRLRGIRDDLELARQKSLSSEQREMLRDVALPGLVAQEFAVAGVQQAQAHQLVPPSAAPPTPEELGVIPPAKLATKGSKWRDEMANIRDRAESSFAQIVDGTES